LTPSRRTTALNAGALLLLLLPVAADVALPQSPSRTRSSSGVTSTPSKLPPTALSTAAGASPWAADVSTTHMLLVVGTHAITTKPSRKSAWRTLGAQVRSACASASAASGSSPKLKPWMSACSLTCGQTVCRQA
jgi:hypothetical protein